MSKPRRDGARAVSFAFLVVGVALALLASLVFALVGTAAAYTVNGGGSSGGIEPNPMLEGNATVATHFPTWAPLEYGVTTGGVGNLTAHVDKFVKNPFQINPSGVVAAGVYSNEKIAGDYWNSTTQAGTAPVTTAQWDKYWSGLGGGSSTTGPTTTTYNGFPAVQFTFNVSSHASSPTWVETWAVPDAGFPSTNLAFDYVTFGATVTGPALASTKMYAVVGNATTQGGTELNAYFGTSMATGALLRDTTAVTSCALTCYANIAGGAGTLYYSAPLASLSNSANTYGGNFNQTVSTEADWGVAIIPGSAATTTTYTVTVFAVAMTTAPLSLGNTLWGNNGAGATAKSVQVGAFFGTENLTTLAPTFAYTSITAASYTVAIGESATDLCGSCASATASAINVANATASGPPYVEQISYSFAYGLPIQASLSYSNFKLVDMINVSGAQYQSVTFGGTSYTTSYQGYTIGAQNVVSGTVSATAPNTWFGLVYYTGPQWDSIAQSPGIFSSSGIEYFWFVLLGLILATVGGSSAWVTSNERALRSRRGVAPAPGARLAEWAARRRRLRESRSGKAEGRHMAAAWVGLIFAGAGGIALWAVLDGADTSGAFAAFVGGLLVLLVVAVIAFVAYEVAHRVRHRHG